MPRVYNCIKYYFILGPYNDKPYYIHLMICCCWPSYVELLWTYLPSSCSIKFRRLILNLHLHDHTTKKTFKQNKYGDEWITPHTTRPRITCRKDSARQVSSPVHARSADVTAVLRGDEVASGSGFTSKNERWPDGLEVFLGGDAILLTNKYKMQKNLHLEIMLLRCSNQLLTTSQYQWWHVGMTNSEQRTEP